MSQVEHALRQLRHEAPTVTTHTLRNLIILVAILIAATGLTIWMMQGAAPRDPSSGPASAQRSPAEVPPSEGDWNSSDLDRSGINDLDDRWAWGATATVPPQRAPAIDSWPPGRTDGSLVPGPQGRFTQEASASLPFRLGTYPPGRFQDAPDGHQRPTPVANLNHIEPPPFRR